MFAGRSASRRMKYGKPILPKGNVNTHPKSALHQPPLQIGANSIQHLKLEIIFRDSLLRRPANRLADHLRIMRRDPVINAAR